MLVTLIASETEVDLDLETAVDTAASSAAEEVFGRKSRLFVRDRTTGCKFLVDSGANASIIPVSKEKEHQDHIKLVFDRFQQYGLRINVAKSVMGADQVEYLITPEGSCPLPKKVETINNYKIPDTIHELRTFLGMINFYRRYLKNVAKTQGPLHDLLKGAKKKDQRKVPWTESTIKNFEQCKSDLSKAALLSYPKFGMSLSLCADASDFAIGSVLQQHLLEGNGFITYTDHKPLTFAFQQKNDKASPKQQRQLQYISEFSSHIRHILGKDNVVSYALSRIEAMNEINYDAIAKEQVKDEELKQLMQNNSSLKFKPSTLPSGKTLWCDISTPKMRPYIPQKFRLQIFQLIHGFAHPDVKSTIKLMTEKYVSSNIKKQVREWAMACIRCQKCKVTRHTKSKFGEYQEPDERFSVVHIDLI
ncbi:retrovirus-related Pol polyprotein from transposon opus [Nephila pilipes]|uniref:RNA-directed DNA polymerase n=1 Tax=Nephila pilipes TaxID=299642 RepID=A0A8X6IXV7_NEPPI|nr:retrovirus-related Pol polyprotein from transposon opus [Nephila pilipes]